MSNHVTPETAKKLKAAGFPQPELSHGQFWTARRYPDGTARHDALLIVNSKKNLIPFDGGNHVELNNRVFMPIATDILKELPQGYYLCDTKTVWQVGSIIVESAGQNQAWAKGDVSTHWARSTHANPAEACALAWLTVNA